MTSAEMQYNFELKMNTLHVLDKPFTSYDINQWFNKSMDDIVVARYSNEEGDPREHFEHNEKLRIELASLIKDYNQTGGQLDTTNIALHSNGSFVTLPSDFLFSIKEDCTITYSDCNDESATNITKVKPVTHDEYLMNINNPFKKPYNELIWRMDYQGVATGTIRHELITDEDCTITNYHLRYIKRPDRINILTGSDCQLSSVLHEEVVDRAVNYATIFLRGPNVEQNTKS